MSLVRARGAHHTKRASLFYGHRPQAPLLYPPSLQQVGGSCELVSVRAPCPDVNICSSGSHCERLCGTAALEREEFESWAMGHHGMSGSAPPGIILALVYRTSWLASHSLRTVLFLLLAGIPGRLTAWHPAVPAFSHTAERELSVSCVAFAVRNAMAS